MQNPNVVKTPRAGGGELPDTNHRSRPIFAVKQRVVDINGLRGLAPLPRAPVPRPSRPAPPCRPPLAPQAQTGREAVVRAGRLPMLTTDHVSSEYRKFKRPFPPPASPRPSRPPALPRCARGPPALPAAGPRPAPPGVDRSCSGGPPLPTIFFQILHG
jgi:hypothetical protein